MWVLREHKKIHDLKLKEERRALAFSILGNKCRMCMSGEDLIFHHKDRNSKICNISKMWTWSIERFMKEVNKCEVVCVSCHKELHAPLHGTHSRYVNRRCRCGLCISAHREYETKQRIRRSNLIGRSGDLYSSCNSSNLLTGSML